MLVSKSGSPQVINLKPRSVRKLLTCHPRPLPNSEPFGSAIGYSTNLISRQSNLIVVRGSGNKTPYEQLVASAERFFSRSGVLDRDDVHPRDPDAAFARMEGRRDERLPRINTGLSSLVGDDNGQRAGGFVLVIDGDALQAVSLQYPFISYDSIFLMIELRRTRRTIAKSCCFRFPPAARRSSAVAFRLSKRLSLFALSRTASVL